MKPNWPKIKLGKISDFRNGINYTKESFGKGLKVIGVKDFQNYSVPIYDEIEEINPNGVVKSADLLQQGDILFVRSNGNRELIGRSLFIDKLNEQISHSGFTIRLRFTTEIVVPKFYSYLFRSKIIREHLSLFGGGTNISNLNQQTLSNLIVPLPPLTSQRRIAEILSGYDDLIENNTHRIRILEQMAQAVYREWFCTVNVASLPEGWKIQTMQEVANVVDCLHSKKPSPVENGAGLFLQLNNIGENGKLDLTDKFLLTKEDYDIWTSRIEASEGDCVITNVGRVAAVAQIPVGVKAALGRNMTGVRPRVITPTYLLEFLLSPQMKNEVQMKKDGGAIMDAMNVRGIIRLELLVPPQETLHKFEKLVRPIRRKIEILIEQNANLRKTRDLLLPKLVSGEIDLEKVTVK